MLINQNGISGADWLPEKSICTEKNCDIIVAKEKYREEIQR
jgi:hypothetical protein